MSKDFDFNEIGKKTPFRTPEGFFERMQAETLKRVAEEKRRKKMHKLKWGVSVALAIAAMCCGFIFFPATQTEPAEQQAPVEWMAQSNDDVVEVYLQSLTDEELQNWIEFSENDIFYELTTETLDEDED